jgi:hypothetical protein
MLDDAAEGRFTAVRVVWRDRLAQFAGGLDRAVLEFLTEVKPPGGS